MASLSHNPGSPAWMRGFSIVFGPELLLVHENDFWFTIIPNYFIQYSSNFFSRLDDELSLKSEEYERGPSCELILGRLIPNALIPDPPWIPPPGSPRKPLDPHPLTFPYVSGVIQLLHFALFWPPTPTSTWTFVNLNVLKNKQFMNDLTSPSYWMTIKTYCIYYCLRLRPLLLTNPASKQTLRQKKTASSSEPILVTHKQSLQKTLQIPHKNPNKNPHNNPRNYPFKSPNKNPLKN